jgi:mono/diheme cytochrome c family protein
VIRKHAGIGAVVIVILSILLAGIASAADISIAVGAPGSVTVGDRVEVKAIVTSGGQPVEGAIVGLTYQTSFAGVGGSVELDRESTNANGVALFEYEQRAADNGEMRVAYLGPDDIIVEPFTFTIHVAPGGEPQYVQQAGVDIPGLNGTLVMIVIGLVWALLGYTAIQLVLIGRRTSGPTTEPYLTPDTSEAGSAWLSVILAVAVIITAAGMMFVLSRNPLTQAKTGVAGGYNRTPIAYLEVGYPYVGPGLENPSIADTQNLLRDGRLIYFQYGCAGCHGLAGTGGVVAPELVGEVGSVGGFAEDVRDGPKNMPGYEPSVLSDEDLAKIHGYLGESDDKGG